MRSEYESRVNRVRDYVRAHLAEDLSLAVLAKVAAFSPHHFHRVFKSITGERLTRFVQRCRLERAAYLMKASPERPLGAIAMDVGFGTQSDFSRVFRSHYGVAPSVWDRRSRLDEVEVIDGYAEALAAAKREVGAVEVHITQRPAVRLAYVRVQTPFLGPKLQDGFERLTGWLEAHGIDWRSRALLGMSWDHYETTPIDQVTFDFGVEVDAHVDGDEDVGIHALAAHASAEVQVDGPLSHIAVAWDHLYDEWLPESAYEPADLPGIKRFSAAPTDWETWSLRCCVPVRANAQDP